MDASSSQTSPVAFKLGFITRFSYGVGHVLNDLCASMWFTYLLLYFHKIIGLSNVMAGNLLLLGQVVDAVATPFVGYESDRINGCCGYGKRKSWHLIGSICVAASFAFIFNPVFGAGDITAEGQGTSWSSFIYYAPFIAIFQFGWASTQISHLALIPEISACEHNRVGLNAIRYAFTVISNITVYAIAYLLLELDSHSGSAASSGDLDPSDYLIFRTLVFTVLGIGVLFTAIFHFGTKEKKSDLLSVNSEFSVSVRRRMGALCWLKTPQFYLVALLYMCTRLIVNISQVYLSMYLTETLELPKTYIAIIPLTVFISGFFSTLGMKQIVKRIGKKILYTSGLALVIGASIWYQFMQPNNSVDKYLILAPAILAGVGGSTVLVLSLSLTADLICDNTESGAFVYGAMSFTDKLSNGVAIQIIQLLHPCKSEACCSACAPFYRSIMVFVPIGCAVVAFVALLLIRRRQTEYLPINPDSTEPLKTGSVHPKANYGSVASETLATTDSNGYITERNTVQPTLVEKDRKPSFIVGSSPDTSVSSP